MSEETELPEGESPVEPPAPQPVSEADPNYKVFAREYDEEVYAEELAEPRAGALKSIFRSTARAIKRCSE